MNFKKIMTISLFLLIAVMCINSTAANENTDIDNNITEDLSSVVVETDDASNLNEELESASDDNESLQVNLNDEAVLSDTPKVINVTEVSENHNEMGSSGTIQKAIDSANAGDTIVIQGRSYVHCHFVITKKLTIISYVGTTMSVCPSNTQGSNHLGIFYISPKASGTVIEGFSLNSDVYDEDDYGILVSGASNVVIRNCTVSNSASGDAIRVENTVNAVVENVTVLNTANGIRVKNSQGTVIRNSIIKNSKYGVYDVDSTKTAITLNSIISNSVAGVAVAGSSNNPTISFNNVTNNLNGFALLSSDNINILNNYIATNTQYGVYVNCQITNINIIGNFFYKNTKEEVFNDVNTKGLYQKGGEKLEVVNNNYIVGLDNRPVQRSDSVGGGVFLGYVFEINTNVNCPIIYSSYNKGWDGSVYELRLSNISQSKKGVYSISIVDKNGNVIKDISSVPITFYLNKDNNYVTPQEGDVYKTVMMVNGTATVRFYPDDFKQSGNIVTAVSPGFGEYLTSDSGKNVQTFAVDDEYIPGNVTATRISVSNINTFPNSNVNFVATLTDINNNPISGEEITFTIGSKIFKATTNSKGQASIKINQNVGTFTAKVAFTGDDIDYSSSSAQAKITVKKVSTKIIASNYAMFIKKADYYQLTLKDSSGKLLSGQKVIIKVNKKTYNRKTNSKGVIKIKLKLKKGTYKVVMTFKGTAKYAASKKTNKIFLKKVLKTKITAPKITTTPKTATKYTVTLKDENGKALKKQKIIVKVNGKKYTKKTNGKGQVTVKVKFSKLKSYKVKATYKKTKLYKKSSATGRITVQKIATKITAPNMNSIPNTAKDYTVTLKTSAGKAIAKQSLKVTLNGKTYTKTTNSKGQITIQTKFSAENSYKATVTYSGSTIYKNSKATGTIKVSRTQTQLIGYDRTFSKNSSEMYSVTLKDASGKAISGQAISYILNNQSFSQNTDANGQIKINVSSLDEGSYSFESKFAQTNQYKASSFSGVISVSNKTDVTFIDAGLPSDEIQTRLSQSNGNVEFLADTYSDVSLTIDRPLNITFKENTTLTGKAKSPVLTITASNLTISDLTIYSNEASGILIKNAGNVTLENNIISNILDSSKSDKYNSGELILPGNGIELSGAEGIKIIANTVKSFGNAIFVENTYNLEISNNTLSLSNYGINYASGVKNTNISFNLIEKNIGLYVMDVPEGPLGYGIFLNQSAVNVSIINNSVVNNYLGISIDSNYSTGIVILSNLICDNALEGIRFNAGYDLAENAVEPNVNHNAIYRNAKGPSMMILGELSANPGGIYQYGVDNETKRLQLGTNWYGKNARVTWDNDTNTTGYGTMCPRINTTYISAGEIEVTSPGVYEIKFYNGGAVDTLLPVFEMYATLNDDVEIIFNVTNGVGTFSFDSGYLSENNQIKVSIGSLSDQYRTFEVLLNKTLDSGEIPA